MSWPQINDPVQFHCWKGWLLYDWWNLAIRLYCFRCIIRKTFLFDVFAGTWRFPLCNNATYFCFIGPWKHFFLNETNKYTNKHTNTTTRTSKSDEELFWNPNHGSQQPQQQRFREESIPSMHFTPINSNSQRTVFEHLNHGPVPVRGAQLHSDNRAQSPAIESRNFVQQSPTNSRQFQAIAGQRPSDSQFNGQSSNVGHFQQQVRTPEVQGNFPTGLRQQSSPHSFVPLVFRKQQTQPQQQKQHQPFTEHQVPFTAFTQQQQPNTRFPNTNRPLLTAPQTNPITNDDYDGSNDEQPSPTLDWNEQQQQPQRQAQQTLQQPPSRYKDMLNYRPAIRLSLYISLVTCWLTHSWVPYVLHVFFSSCFHLSSLCMISEFWKSQCWQRILNSLYFFFYVEHLLIPECQLEPACPATINSIEEQPEVARQRLNPAAMPISLILGKPQFLKDNSQLKDRALLLVSLPSRKGQSPPRQQNAQQEHQSSPLITSLNPTSTIMVSRSMSLPLLSLLANSLPIMISLKIVSLLYSFNFRNREINMIVWIAATTGGRPQEEELFEPPVTR